MTEVDDVGQVLAIIFSVVHGVLDAAVQIDGQNRLRTRRNTTCTERITKTIVLNFVAQTATRRQRIGVVAHVGEERVAL